MLKKHTNETHICDICAKVFTNSLSLKEHLKTHAEAKYMCNECGKKFVRPNHLRQHKKYTHRYVNIY